MSSAGRYLSVSLLILMNITIGADQTLADKYPALELRGRVHLDYAVHQEDQVALFDQPLIRRSRMGISGDLDSNWSFVIEYDFSEESLGASAINLTRSFKYGELIIGQTKTPMSLSQLTGSNNIPFIERSTIVNIVADSFRLGIYGDLEAGAFRGEAMLFGRGIGDSPADDEDMPTGVAGRLILAPEFAKDHVFHLGVSMARETYWHYGSVRYRERPEARPADVRFIDTGNIRDVRSTTKHGLELAYLRGPFSVEAEYLAVEVDQVEAERNLVFDGYSLQSSMVLTGESRGYGGGSFGGIRPNSSRGAWEVGARYSTADLNDGDVWGGEQRNITLGINYYPNRYVRFMLNHIWVDVQDSTATVRGEEVGDESPRILLLRAQYAF